MQTAVLIPLKAFRGAKARLSPVLDAAERADVNRRMAESVVAGESGQVGEGSAEGAAMVAGCVPGGVGDVAAGLDIATGIGPASRHMLPNRVMMRMHFIAHHGRSVYAYPFPRCITG